MLENILLGLSVAFSPEHLIYALGGVVLGNLVGVLPGIGALAALSMLLPVTYGLDPISALMMLAGIYYGTSFGGALTAILLNLPGTVTHAVVCIEGNPLAQQGKGGQAIFFAIFASFVGTICGIILVMFFAPVLAELGFKFGPAEYFSLLLLGVLGAGAVGTGAPLKGVASVIIGLMCGVIGIDVSSGAERFTFGVPQLADGLSLVALAMGFFGVADVLEQAGQKIEGKLVGDKRQKITARSVRPTRAEVKQNAGAIGRGSILGSFLGMLPAVGGGTLASFLSYALEKKVSKNPLQWGKGAMAGVAGPEAANSAGSMTAFIPTLTLGIPGDVVMALMLGALMIQDITPGPQFITEHAPLFWGLIISFWIGNVTLVILNIPFVSIWVRLLQFPYRMIFPVVLLLVCLGVYSENNDLFGVLLVTIVGVIAFLFRFIQLEGAPLLLGMVLGPLIEENFRRALLISGGDWTTFFTRPISGGFIGVICLGILFSTLMAIRKRARRTKIL
jgi:TctA family transporter